MAKYRAGTIQDQEAESGCCILSIIMSDHRQTCVIIACMNRQQSSSSVVVTELPIPLIAHRSRAILGIHPFEERILGLAKLEHDSISVATFPTPRPLTAAVCVRI